MILNQVNAYFVNVSSSSSRQRAFVWLPKQRVFKGKSTHFRSIAASKACVVVLRVDIRTFKFSWPDNPHPGTRPTSYSNKSNIPITITISTIRTIPSYDRVPYAYLDLIQRADTKNHGSHRILRIGRKSGKHT